MVLFVADMHFGRGDALEQRASEAELIACLRAQADDVRALYLVGDVFDHYIEYRHLVPKGFVRFQALLAAWTERGIPVTYLIGNHDPWHRDYFATELGVCVVTGPLLEPHYGSYVYLHHGDGLPGDDGLYRRLKPLLRHPVPVALYRTLLPGDVGLGLARWVSRRVGGRPVDPVTVQAVREHAQHVLQTTRADVAVLGHSHQMEHHATPDGVYLNPGSWHYSRTFARLDADGPQLLRWHNACTTPALEATHPTPPQ